MRFKFTGTSEEVFPSIVTDAGTLVCKPGDVVELDHDPDHAHLVPDSGKRKVKHTGSLAADWHTPDPEPVEAEPVLEEPVDEDHDGDDDTNSQED